MGIVIPVLALLGGLARAADLVVNGVVVDPAALRGVRLTGVTLTVDERGVLIVTAPGFVVEKRAPTAPTVQPDNGVPRARWWLATEDSGSAGHVVDVEVNGRKVSTLRSGDPVRVLDLGPYLRLGTNAIRVRAVSTAASGGTFYVYVSTGTDESGTVVMDSPSIQFGLGATRSGEYVREYTLDVAP
jgi:hypothetical protein